MIISLRPKQAPFAKVGKASTRYALVLPMVARLDGLMDARRPWKPLVAFLGDARTSRVAVLAWRRSGRREDRLPAHRYQLHRATKHPSPLHRPRSRRHQKYYTSFPYPGCTPRVRSLLTAVAILHARERPPSERTRRRRTRRRRSRGPLQPPPRQHKDGG